MNHFRRDDTQCILASVSSKRSRCEDCQEADFLAYTSVECSVMIKIYVRMTGFGHAGN